MWAVSAGTIKYQYRQNLPIVNHSGCSLCKCITTLQMQINQPEWIDTRDEEYFVSNPMKYKSTANRYLIADAAQFSESS